MSPLEEEALNTIEAMIDAFAAGIPSGKLTYLQVMDLARRTAKRLTNKKFGCYSGAHAGPCNCTIMTRGKSDYL